MDTLVARRAQRLPHNWELPEDLQNRFGTRAGRQRAHEHDGHVVILLHHPPVRGSVRRHAVFFWRQRLGEWSCSEGRHGVETVLEHVTDYEQAIESLEQRVGAASETAEWFEILAEIAPLRRAASNMADALSAAQELLPYGQRNELQDAADAATELARDAELLQQQAEHSIDYLVAQQNEIQARASEAHAEAAYRLNVVAALFLPLATLASIFGMNLPNGMEGFSAVTFWTIVVAGVAAGLLIGKRVMGLRSLKPSDW